MSQYFDFDLKEGAAVILVYEYACKDWESCCCGACGCSVRSATIRPNSCVPLVFPLVPVSVALAIAGVDVPLLFWVFRIDCSLRDASDSICLRFLFRRPAGRQLGFLNGLRTGNMSS